MTHAERSARYARLSTALALMSDEQLARRLNEAEPLAAGEPVPVTLAATPTTVVLDFGTDPPRTQMRPTRS